MAVKNDSLSEVAPTARALAEAGSVILPLLNWVEAVERLVGHGVPGDRVLGGLTAISVERVGPGLVERVIVGEAAAGGPGRAEPIAAALRGARAEPNVSGDIAAEVWR